MAKPTDSTPARVRRYYTPGGSVGAYEGDRVNRTLAALLGARSPGAAHQRWLAARRVLRAYLRACQESGATVRITSLIAEVHAARAAIRPTDGVITPDDWQRYHGADALEDAAPIRPAHRAERSGGRAVGAGGAAGDRREAGSGGGAAGTARETCVMTDLDVALLFALAAVLIALDLGSRRGRGITPTCRAEADRSVRPDPSPVPPRLPTPLEAAARELLAECGMTREVDDPTMPRRSVR